MKARLATFLLPLLLLSAGCLGERAPGAVGDGPDGKAGAGAWSWSAPVALPDSGDVTEPHLAIDSTGRIFVSAPTGLPSASPLWISEDDGATWTKVAPNPLPMGGGDTSVAIGPDDEVYLTDLWAGSSTILSSTDSGKTWTLMPLAGAIPYHDREWNTVGLDGTAYYLGRVFTPGVATTVSKSTDGGLTWAPAGTPWAWAGGGDADRGSQNGGFFTNPGTGAIGVSYSCGTNAACLSFSADQGTTWTRSVAAQAEGDVANIFVAGAADTAGNWYVAYAERVGDDTRIMLVSSPDGVTWNAPVVVAEGPGNRLFPWVVAGDAGRVNVVWYSSDARGDNNDAAAMEGAEWRVFAATSFDALDAAPSWTIDTITRDPIHTGTVSTGGLGGSADRSLGDFFANALDPQGRVHIAFMKALDGDVATMHARMTSGPSLYVNGMRPTPGGAADEGDAAAPAAPSVPTLQPPKAPLPTGARLPLG